MVVAAVALAMASGGFVAQADTLPDHRAYELVSPPDKNGSDVMLTALRTRAAADGNAFGYGALAGFGDVHGVEVSSDYVSVRSATPGTSGWTTHGVTPPQRTLTIAEILAAEEPIYMGPYSSDLTTGIFSGISPLTSDPLVSGVPNLYRRSDLLTPGLGTFSLVTGCPACQASGTPLPPAAREDVSSQLRGRPLLEGTSPDFEHIAFEVPQSLTPDAPAQPALCDPTTFPFAFACGERLYEWDHGVVRLAGVLPDGTAADASFAGQGADNHVPTPDVVSDGSDGHTRIFFTQPTDGSGGTWSTNPFGVFQSTGGNVFVRVDHASTEQLNASERTTPDAFAPAQFLDASKDGTRAFFMTSQALTDDAPADGNQKIYMYDATRPASHRLTLIDPDSEPGDATASAEGALGMSDDGHYFYFYQSDQLIRGGPISSRSDGWLYLWHEGQLTLVGPAAPQDMQPEDEVTGADWALDPRQSRVSADGRILLFSTNSGSGLTGYDHGTCITGLGSPGCRELYVYDADTGRVACASCNPSGAPAVGMASVYIGASNTTGGTRLDPENTNPLTADGSKVFFSSPDALVPQDTNGRIDAYEYDVSTGRVSLLTTGTNTSDSYFVNADPNGRDAFVMTRQQLVGWDTDDSYDMYDVRVDGGFPAPPPPALPCQGDACHGLPAPGIGAYTAQGSAVFSGAGDLSGRLKARKVARRKSGGQSCKKGQVLKKVRGKRRCVKTASRARSRAGKARARRSGGKRGGRS